MRLEMALFLAHPVQDPRRLPEGGWREVALPHQWTLEGLEAEVGWYRLQVPEVGPRRFLRLWGDCYQEAWLEGVANSSSFSYHPYHPQSLLPCAIL